MNEILNLFRKIVSSSNRISLLDKSLMFVSLFLLLFKCKFQPKKEISHRFLGFTIHSPNPQLLYHLLLEIFVDEVYYFKYSGNAPSIVDAGSNIGISILYFKYRYPRATILAFEPNPKSIRYLNQNLIVNDLSEVHLVPAALSNQEERIEVKTSNNFFNFSIMQKLEDESAIEVNTVCLSQYLKNSRFDCIKMDIEGAEQLVLEDLFHTSTIRNVSIYVIEFHIKPNLNTPHVEFLQKFDKNGFTLMNEETSLKDLKEDKVLKFSPKI